jgi:prephenate dehydrogenase
MTIAIVGPGLIGKSVALAARRADLETHITEIDQGQSMTAARDADLIVLATPVDVILHTIRHHADVLRSSIVFDTGSTKRAIMAAARAEGLTTFVGGHPMAGAASSGPAFARDDLFDGRPWFLVTEGATEAAIGRVRTFVETLGAQPVMMSDDGGEHDRVMAAVSHVPQVVASTLMVVVAEAAGDRLEWAGKGFRDTTRLAASSETMWQSILETNADEVAPLLRAMARHLDTLADQLTDKQRVSELLRQASRARALL